MSNDPFAPIGGAPNGPGAKAKDRKFSALVMPVPAGAPAAPKAHPELGAPSAVWEYRDGTGGLLGYACRFDPKAGKEFRPLALFRGEGGALTWKWKSWPSPRPLYGLDRLAARPNAPVVVCEGEKAADAAGLLLPGHVAITSPNGSNNATKADWDALRGRRVLIWPDNDAPGFSYADTAAEMMLEAGAAAVARLDPPDDVYEGWDAADALAEAWSEDRATRLVAGARTVEAPSAGPSDGGTSEAPGRKRAPAQRDTIMAVVDGIKLWHSPEREGFATFTVGDHLETWPIKSTIFKEWLSYQAYRALNVVPGAQGVDDVVRILTAKATNEGPRHEPWTRTGLRNGRLYIDLCNEAWEAVEIDGGAWRILKNHDLPFVRSGAMQALPMPETEDACAIEELRPFINASDDDFRLIVAWLVGALRDRGPYPVLILNGQQGTGKSFLSTLLRSLVDPNTAPIRAAPKDDQDLLTIAINAHTLVIDNMSSVPVWLSDALCRLATGGGFATRAHYTNKEENVLQATKPILLNGIPSLVDRPDLGDRAVTVRLLPIPEEGRLPEDVLKENWARAYPRIFAALCTALSAALRHLPEVKLVKSPRLADFAKWVTAAEPGLGWEPGSFLEVYNANRVTIREAAHEASPLSQEIEALAADTRIWTGTATELLKVLNDRAPFAVKSLKIWPSTAQGLGNAIDRVGDILKSRGVVVERRHSGTRTVTIALAEAYRAPEWV